MNESNDYFWTVLVIWFCLYLCPFNKWAQAKEVCKECDSMTHSALGGGVDTLPILPHSFGLEMFKHLLGGKTHLNIFNCGFNVQTVFGATVYKWDKCSFPNNYYLVFIFN